MSASPNYFLCFFLALFPCITFSLEVIRVNVEHNSIDQNFDIQLFDTIATDTVTNFLSYIDDNSYDNLFINRSIKDFVIQTGGYTYDSSLGGFSISGTNQFDGGLQPVTTKPTVNNEFQLSNLRGTLAMAKKQNLPDSATKEWFINLADNSFLDESNSGFTVFGKVLGDGLAVIDSIAEIPIFNLSTQLNNDGDFVSTPLTNFNESLTVQDITDSNLIFFRTFKHLFKITDMIDFGDSVVGTSIQKDIIVSNTGNTPLTIGNIDTSNINTAFSILSNDCTNSTLSAGMDCIITVDFSPLTNNYFINTLEIPIQTYGYSFPVRIKTPSPELLVEPETINFDTQQIYDSNTVIPPKQSIVLINNEGDRDLNLSSITFSGTNTDDFEFIDNCMTDGNAHTPGVVPPESFCILVVKFKPKNFDIKTAFIEITSDDPINSFITIAITGGKNDDNDNVLREIEDSAPNSGDGNNDGLPDGLQNSVVSFVGTNNIYTTLVTESTFKFNNFETRQLSTMIPLPEGIVLKNEAFTFELSGLEPGSIANFGIILPEGYSPKSIYSFGATQENSTPHWYELNNGSIPGNIIIGDSLLFSPTGEKIKRSVSRVTIQDGGTGDSDLEQNGTIVFTGGPEIKNQNISTSRIQLWWVFCIPLITLLFRNNYNCNSDSIIT